MKTFDQRDLDTLARTIYGEAEANNAADAKAVAWVIVNRCDLPNWPNTVAQVCLQPWQFSCWNPGDPNRERILNANSTWFNRCQEIALGVLNGEIHDPTDGSTHYYATFIKTPKWAKGKTPVLRVNHGRKHAHLFFNDIDTPPPRNAKQALDQVKPLTNSRTVAGATALTATGAGAVATGVIQQVADSAPAVSVVSEVARTAQEHPSGLLILFGVAVIAAALFLIYLRWDDRRKGIR